MKPGIIENARLQDVQVKARFGHFNAQDDSPVALVYFTDLECSDCPTEPDYPVLWVTPIDSTPEDMPFGRTVRMDLYAD